MMLEKFKRYRKYYVLKESDISRYLNEEEILMMGRIEQYIVKRRIEEGKKNHSYVVVNEDMPYAEQVWGLIQEHWELKKKKQITIDLSELQEELGC